MIEFTSMRHAFPEAAGFFMDRKRGHRDYTFLHFFNNMEIEYNGEIIETAPHSVIIYDIRTPQYFKSIPPLTHDWIHFKGDISDLLSENDLKLNTLYYPEQTAFITKLTQELESEFYSSHKNSQKLMQLKFEELFIKLGRAVSENAEPEIQRETKNKFRHLRAEILSNLSENWTIDKMAEKINYSNSHFAFVYKTIYGITPTADLINARINSAKNMLTLGNKNVNEIAASLGYRNTPHFIRQFKEKTGFSPNEYRKRKQ